jgi:CarboxypepD_reg-like domain/TonB-dependent Receptor Plug Domain
MKKYLYLLLFAVLAISTGSAQTPKAQKYTLSGYVKDSTSGEYLIGTSVYIKELQKGVNCNTYGFYSMTVEGGNYTIITSFVGYKEKVQSVNLNKDQTLNIDLAPRVVETKEVVVSAQKADKNVKSTEMGRVEVEVEQIKSLPALMGEVDVLKTIQLLPGVKSAGEGNSGFYVRGGGPDQNLILLDEAVVYNASHLFGFFSVFNSDAIKNIALTKGGMPAQYGGRLASVLDISMKEGNNKEFHGDGGLGYIASRLTLEGPIVKNKSSFIISGRRTFIDLFLREPFIDKNSNFAGNSYYFYDVNAKLNYTLSQKDRLFVSGYFGRDVFNFKSSQTGFKVRIPWGNATTSLRWNHLYSDKLFMNSSLIFTDYKFEFGAVQQQFDFRIFSGIRDYAAKVDFNWFPNILHNVKFGVNYTYHRFTPTNVSAKAGDVVFDLGKITRFYAHDVALYANDEWDITEKLRVNAGFRATMFEHVGPFTRYVQDPSFPGKFTDTIDYSTGEKVKMYTHIEPRISMRYELKNNASIKASFTQNYQYIHLASFGSVSLPTDIWVPSTDLVKPQFGTQYSVGYFKNLKENMFETSVELYYKTMKNQIDYREGSTPDQDVKNNPDNNFVFGEGESYGAEFFVKKAKGKVTGWIGYTLSYTNKKFPDLNNGNSFPAKYDRRHDASFVMTYEFSKKWTFGAVWVYSTGDALTLPSQRYFVSAAPPISINGNGNIEFNNNFNVLSDYGKRNDFRQKAYHRLDISATLHVQKERKYKSEWVFSIYNVYSRMNPYFIYFDVQGNSTDGNLAIQAKQVSLFGMIPSVTYNFKF